MHWTDIIQSDAPTVPATGRVSITVEQAGIIISLPSLDFAAFRAACEGGGSPPEWTRAGDDPSAWRNADGAAGRLWLASWGAGEGDYPPDTDPDGWVATYQSSSDAIVALGYVYQDGGPMLAIYRPGQTPRLGTRGEAALAVAFPPSQQTGVP